ncbi:MAG TPA: WG repeat-containing protein, partial [bacterium]|nr:WG repeat-containing protein [bacterium]
MSVPLDYQWIGDFKDGKAAAIRNGKFGIIDTSGLVVLPFRYDGLGPWSEGRVRMAVGVLYGFIDWGGRTVVEPRYEDVGVFSEGRAWVKQDGRFGFIDAGGRVRVPIRFGAVQDFHDGLAAVQDGGKWGYVDPEGHWVIPARYDDAEQFSDGRAGVWLSSKDEGADFDFIDKKGKAVFSRPYDCEEGLPIFQDGEYREYEYDPVHKSEDWVYYGTQGQVLRKEPFDPGKTSPATGLPPDLWAEPPASAPPGVWKVRNLQAPFRVVESAPQWGYIDASGKVQVQPQYDDARPFQEGLAVADQGPDVVWIGPSGKELFRKPRDLYGKNAHFAVGYHEGLIRFMDRGKLLDPGGGGAAPEYDDHYGAADREGNIVLPPIFREMGVPSEGLVFGEVVGDPETEARAAVYRLDGTKAFDDPDWAQEFSEGMAAVRGGYLDTNGKKALEVVDGINGSFREGLASLAVGKGAGGTKYGFIDRKGQWAIPPRFCFADPFSEGLAGVQEKEGGKWGYIDHAGNMVLAPRWGWVHDFR